MSRIGKNPINIPDGVKINIDGHLVMVTGPKGSLKFNHHKDIKISQDGDTLLVERTTNMREHRALHGTTRQMINNMVVGVSKGFSKDLEIIGVGYNAVVQGNRLQLQLGFSHDIFFDLPEGITITANKTDVKVEGIDKQLVGAVAAKIRSFRKPEPYKGKGVRYKNEYVRSKQGKTVGAK
tara:strand:+ start:1372 stop:1911 length:540 start_codon:yes stop_codon:yes gene_type:complete